MNLTPQSGHGEDFAPVADINVTPFIDVMLVLLIIFMVTAPLLAQGMKVDLPKAASAQQLDSSKQVVVTVTASGQVQVADAIVPRESLLEVVRARLAGNDQVIQLRGDREAKYGDIVAVIDALASGGLTKYALVLDRGEGARRAK